MLNESYEAMSTEEKKNADDQLDLHQQIDELKLQIEKMQKDHEEEIQLLENQKLDLEIEFDKQLKALKKGKPATKVPRLGGVNEEMKAIVSILSSAMERCQELEHECQMKDQEPPIVLKVVHQNLHVAKTRITHFDLALGD